MADSNSLSVNDLFSDNASFDKQEVIKTLMPLVAVQKSDNQICLRDMSLSAKQKILAYALAKKLLKLEGMIENETVTASELCQATGLKKGTVDPNLMGLKQDRLLLGKSGKSECEIPAYQVRAILNLLTKNTD